MIPLCLEVVLKTPLLRRQQTNQPLGQNSSKRGSDLHQKTNSCLPSLEQCCFCSLWRWGKQKPQSFGPQQREVTRRTQLLQHRYLPTHPQQLLHYKTSVGLQLPGEIQYRFPLAKTDARAEAGDAEGHAGLTLTHCPRAH